MRVRESEIEREREREGEREVVGVPPALRRSAVHWNAVVVGERERDRKREREREV